MAIWLAVNLIQSAFTELHPDEAYYWMYSRWLAWGYFDHPPMIAFLVKTGYLLFKNELGVRLLTSIMGAGTLYFIYLLVKDQLKNLSVLILLLLSVLIVQSHIGGFLAIPDLPLVFFSVVFLYLYKKYVDQDNFTLAVLLGVVASLMLYSKYHAVLVLFFTLISNLKLFRRLSFWIIPIIIILALLPHLFWQIKNNFPTFEYHLISRSSAYKLDHSINYLYSQLLISGPLIGIIIYYHSFKLKVKDNLFLRALKFNFIGFMAFFFLMSFKGHVEPHWTAVAYIAGIVLTTISIQNNEKAKKWLRVLVLPTVLLFLLIRFILIFDVLPDSVKIDKDFHNWDAWADVIKKRADGKKVVFVDSFQRPSKYAFYTGGDFVHVLNSIHYRKNQFDIWHGEDSIQGRSVLLMKSYIPNDTLITSNGEFRIKDYDKFYSYFNIKIKPDCKRIKAVPEQELDISIEIENTRNDTLKFRSSEPGFAPRIVLNFHDGKHFLSPQQLQFLTGDILVGESEEMNLHFTAPPVKGVYYCYLSINNDRLRPPLNSKPFELIVE